MKPDPCNEIPLEVLVDYSDGGLPADQRAQVCEHVKKCEDCRGKLRALERSLQVAQLIWRDAEAQIGRAHAPAESKSRVFVSAWRLGVAASLLLAVSGFFVKRFLLQERQRPIPQPLQQATLEEIENQVKRAGLAAQLFATAEVLDKVEGGQAAAERQYAYIAERYADTEQAAEARRRLEERRNP